MYIKATRLNGQVIHYRKQQYLWYNHSYHLLDKGKISAKRVERLPILESIKRTDNKIVKLIKITFEPVSRFYNRFTQSYTRIGGKTRTIINK